MRVLADKDVKTAIIICFSAQERRGNMNVMRTEIEDIKKDPNGACRDEKKIISEVKYTLDWINNPWDTSEGKDSDPENTGIETTPTEVQTLKTLDSENCSNIYVIEVQGEERGGVKK